MIYLDTMCISLGHNIGVMIGICSIVYHYQSLPQMYLNSFHEWYRWNGKDTIFQETNVVATGVLSHPLP